MINLEAQVKAVAGTILLTTYVMGPNSKMWDVTYVAGGENQDHPPG